MKIRLRIEVICVRFKKSASRFESKITSLVLGTGEKEAVFSSL